MLGGGKTGKKVTVTAKNFWVRYFIATVTEHFFSCRYRTVRVTVMEFF
jgi:hypothetical protein